MPGRLFRNPKRQIRPFSNVRYGVVTLTLVARCSIISASTVNYLRRRGTPVKATHARGLREIRKWFETRGNSRRRVLAESLLWRIKAGWIILFVDKRRVGGR